MFKDKHEAQRTMPDSQSICSWCRERVRGPVRLGLASGNSGLDSGFSDHVFGLFSLFSPC